MTGSFAGIIKDGGGTLVQNRRAGRQDTGIL